MLPGVAADSAEAQPFWVGCVVCVPGWKSIFYFFFFKKLERLKDTGRKQEAWELECESTEPQLLAITTVLCPVTPHRKAFTQSWRNMFILEPSPNQVLHCCLGDNATSICLSFRGGKPEICASCFSRFLASASMNNEEKALATHR